MSDKCPQCGSKQQNAHDGTPFCPDIEGCGWDASDTPARMLNFKKAQRVLRELGDNVPGYVIDGPLWVLPEVLRSALKAQAQEAVARERAKYTPLVKYLHALVIPDGPEHRPVGRLAARYPLVAESLREYLAALPLPE